MRCKGMLEKELIQKGHELYEIMDVDRLTQEYELWRGEVLDFLEKNRSFLTGLGEIKLTVRYTKNEYSDEELVVCKTLEDMKKAAAEKTAGGILPPVRIRPQFFILSNQNLFPFKSESIHADPFMGNPLVL